MTDIDYHLSTLCDPTAGGCGARPGENCLPECGTNQSLVDDDSGKMIEWEDVDFEYDNHVERFWNC